jgi:hypothetical protein
VSFFTIWRIILEKQSARMIWNLQKDQWSKPTSNGTFIWKEYIQSHHVQKPQLKNIRKYAKMNIKIKKNQIIMVNRISKTCLSKMEYIIYQFLLVKLKSNEISFKLHYGLEAIWVLISKCLQYCRKKEQSNDTKPVYISHCMQRLKLLHIHVHVYVFYINQFERYQKAVRLYL